MGAIFEGCPGANLLKTPEIKEKICPVCGSVIELFTTDVSVKCDKCGFVAYNDMQSCIKWCRHAEQCVGPELYHRLMDREKEMEQK